jgi:hypothetical protein
VKALVIHITQPAGSPNVLVEVNQGEIPGVPVTPREQLYADKIQAMLAIEIANIAKRLGAVEAIVEKRSGHSN